MANDRLSEIREVLRSAPVIDMADLRSIILSGNVRRTLARPELEPALRGRELVTRASAGLDGYTHALVLVRTPTRRN